MSCLRGVLSLLSASLLLLGTGMVSNADEVGWENQTQINDDSSGTNSELFDYSISEEGVVITKFNGSVLSSGISIKIPSRIDDNYVIGIGDGAFYKSNISEIVIPEGVKTIGNYAFGECRLLSKVNLPSTLEGLGVGAFQDCTELQKVSIPKNVKIISTSTFSGCTKLLNVNMYTGVESIGSMAFANCVALKGVVIPGSVKNIGTYAFDSCFGLKSVMLQEGVRVLEAGAFYRCTSLESIYLPESIVFIDISVFKNCKNLKYVAVENVNVEYFDSSLFGEGEFSRIFTDCNKLILCSYPGSTSEKHANTYKVPFKAVDLKSLRALMGDVDQDGKITSSDSLLTLRESVGLEYLTEYQKRVIDIDEDGTVSSADSLSILRRSVGLN